MEVCRFFDDCTSQPELCKWIASGLDIILEALHVYRPDELCFSFNGGKDCTVVLHLLRAAAWQREERRRNESSESNLELASSSSTSEWCGIRVVYFDGNDDFPEVSAFMAECEAKFGFTIERLPGFRAGLEHLLSQGVRAVLMGTRRGDPDGARLRGPFAPTSQNWPPCMRVCPVLDWPYGAVWSFLRSASLPYCTLYDEGYTSLGSPATSMPNPALALEVVGVEAGDVGAESETKTSMASFLPAWHLQDESLERLGRVKASSQSSTSRAATHVNRAAAVPLSFSSPGPAVFIATAALIIVGDELLSGRVTDSALSFIGEELSRVGRRLAHVAVVPDEVGSIAAAVSLARGAGHAHVFVTGGMGPTHDDVTVAGVSASFASPLLPSPALMALLHAIHGDARMQACPALARMALLPSTPAAQLVYADGTRICPPCAPLTAEWEGLDERGWVRKGYPLLLLGGGTAVFPGVPAILRRKWCTFSHTLFGPPSSHGCSEQVALSVHACTEAELAHVLEKAAAETSEAAAAAGVHMKLGSYPANVDSFPALSTAARPQDANFAARRRVGQFPESCSLDSVASSPGRELHQQVSPGHTQALSAVILTITGMSAGGGRRECVAVAVQQAVQLLTNRLQEAGIQVQAAAQ